jgi:(2Fe-2S) ferredoxin
VDPLSKPVVIHQIKVCQHRSCRRFGAVAVLAAFQQQAVAGVEVQAYSCFGQCGNGPMVLVLPDQVLYCRVLPEEVAMIVEQHLVHGKPVKSMLAQIKSV